MPQAARSQHAADPVQTPAGLVYHDVLDMIGKTPMLEVKNLDTGPCRLFLKMELANPAGSIKDRIGLWMIEAAERDGRIDPSADPPPTLVEGTAGNTGIALALVAGQRGYKLIVVMPDKMSQGKIRHLRAMGADVRLTRSDVQKGDPEYYQDVAERIAKETPNSLYVNQFFNDDNTRAHYESTGPEIIEQIRAVTGEDPGAFVCGVGSGGTLTGVGRALKENNPDTKVLIADPLGSIIEPLVNRGEHIDARTWRVEGMGEDFVPGVCDLSVADAAYAIPDKESYDTARDLLRAEGILTGSSTGCLLAAALRFCREQTEPTTVVTLACDQGAKYLDKVFSEPHLLEEGLSDRETRGDLRDLIPLRHDLGEGASLKPAETVRQAFRALRTHNLPALPVADPERAGALLGELSERDILAALESDPAVFDKPVSSIVNPHTATLPCSASHEDLAAKLRDHERCHIMDDAGAYLGAVPRYMLINRALRAQ